jgi:hypothetical protein
VKHYTFRQRCRPRGDFRISEIIEFLDVVKEAFRCPTLYDTRDKAVHLTEDDLLRRFEKEAKRLLPAVGATDHFFTIPPRKRDDNTVRIEINTGGHPEKQFVDSYDIKMGGELIPDLDYFEKSIEIFKPFEAYVADVENEFRMNVYERFHAAPGFRRPLIMRGFHYLDEGMARSIGGIDYCLKAPVWRAVRFCEGVLMEMFPGPFDDENPKHRRIQEEVLEYFGIPVEFSADDDRHG